MAAQVFGYGKDWDKLLDWTIIHLSLALVIIVSLW